MKKCQGKASYDFFHQVAIECNNTNDLQFCNDCGKWLCPSCTVKVNNGKNDNQTRDHHEI